jgi:pseudouridine-5'-phosphate glycosidase/pseudouridine kinase
MSSTAILCRAHRCRQSQRLLSSLSTARARGANIDVHPEVLHALKTNQPVVALETALVTHGLPAPLNFDAAYSMETIVRSTGAIPATIAFVSGRVKIGLEKHELERLAESGIAGRAVKVSRRDIAATMVKGIDGGTTIAATMIFAAMAGIKVFATGGLGGVHRNGENTMDVSADLQELSKCPVGVISSGVKSILDIGRTLEYLETLGVPVLPYQSPDNEFPAFFTPRSGYKLPWGVNSPLEAAQIIHTHHTLGLQNGQLIAVPIPSGPSVTSSSTISSQGGLLHQTTSTNPSIGSASVGSANSDSEVEMGTFVQSCVDQAVAEAEENGKARSGKEVTPWLLNRVRELSGGKSLSLSQFDFPISIEFSLDV